MITEHKFSASYTSFWRTTIPLGDAFVRQMNTRLQKFDDPMVFDAPAERSALISETAFRLIATGDLNMKSLHSPEIPDPLDVQRASAEASIYLSRLKGPHSNLGDLSEKEVNVCVKVAQRIKRFFMIEENIGRLHVRPQFEGCGFLGGCEGDFIAGRILYEIKNVERTFRLVDVRQVLTYCALNQAKALHAIDGVGWVNPRSGRFYRIGLESLAITIAGCSALELFSEIIDFISRDPFSA